MASQSLALSLRRGWGMSVAALVVLICGAVTNVDAQVVPTNSILIELFSKEASQKCQVAKSFLEQLAIELPGVEIRTHDVIEDRNSRSRLWRLARQFGHQKAGVPSIYVVDRLFVGFENAETTGREIRQLLQIRAFVRPGCRHCEAAKRFLNEMCGAGRR